MTPQDWLQCARETFQRLQEARELFGDTSPYVAQLADELVEMWERACA